MAGNRAIYDRAMEQGREASRQARWDDALKSAVRALQEFPQELEARTLAAVEVPLGILTAVVGTPFFIVLLRSAHQRAQ